MSVKVSSWVWDNGPVKPAEKLLLLALADHANDEGECYPSQPRLQEMTGYSLRYLRDIRDSLITSGYLSLLKAGEGRRNSQYRVNYKTYAIAQVSPEPDNAGQPVPVDPVSPAVDSTLALRPTVPEPSLTVIEPSVNPSGKRKRTGNDDLWDALVTVFGEPSTTTARRLFGKTVRELAEAEATPEQIVLRAAEAKSRWGGKEFSPGALLKWWDSLALKEVEKADLKGNAQLGKNYLGFDYKNNDELLEKLGAKRIKADAG